MKVIIAVIGLSCVSTLACAEVSDDLKFCGSLKSGAERLACYDAAARIAVKSTPARAAARAVPLDAQAAVPFKATALDPLPAHNPFGGYYVGVGGGYGLIGGRTVFDGFGPFDSANGGFVSAVAGRNIGFNWGIVGIEVDGRWLGETAAMSRIINPGTFDSGSGLSSYRYQNDAAAHAALRVGVTYGDSLIFAKAGLGATRITERFSTDRSGIYFCDPSLIPIIYAGFCNPSGFGTLSAAKVTTWVPSAVFGLGLEQNWGPFFGRLGVDFEATNHRTTNVPQPSFFGSTVDQLTWAARGTALIGVRF
jgi:hypothetical protein